MRLHTTILRLLTVGVAFAIATPAFAEIDEIVVTATKREESVQDVPIAVTAISDLELDRAGIKDLRDLAQIAPSFNMNTSQTESQGATMRIRGVGTTGNNIGLESAVGVFLDGVYLSRPGVALGDLMDVERLEVLRGPQGTLFGRNTSAGALNVHTKKPNLEDDEYFLNATVGNFDFYNVQAGASIPLIPGELGVRLVGAWREQDGFTNGPGDNESYTRDRYMLRGQLYWTPTEDLSIRFIADYSDADERCCDGGQVHETPYVGTGAYAAAGLPANGGNGSGGADFFRGRRTNSNDPFINRFDQWGVSLEINYTINENVDMTYIGSYRDFYADSVQDDFTTLDVYAVPDAYDEITSSTHELRFQGSAGEWLDWMVGAYYSDEEITEEATLSLGADYQAYINATGYFGILGAPPPHGLGFTIPGVIGLLGPNPALLFAGGVDADGSFATNLYNQEGTSWSIFTHNTIHLTDTFDFVFGLRWIDEEKDGSFEQLAANSPACLNTIANSQGSGLEAIAIGFACFPFATEADAVVPGPGGVNLAANIVPQTFDDTFKDDELTYTFKFVWAFAEDASAYLSYTHGFKAGGFNLDSTAAVAGGDPRFLSETTDAWELGVKSTLLDNTLRVNMAIFSMEMEDFQVLEFTGIRFQTFNVPEAESVGGEIEVLWSPIDGLSVNSALTYADAAYPSDCDGGPGAPAQVSSLCGFALTNAPKYTATLGFTYEGQLPWNELGYFVSAAWLHTSDRRTSTQGRDPSALTLNPQDVQEDNSKVNLRAGISSADGLWTVELWGNNVFDKQTKNVTYNVPLRGNGGFQSAARGTFYEAPRTYGVTLRLQF